MCRQPGRNQQLLRSVSAQGNHSHLVDMQRDKSIRPFTAWWHAFGEPELQLDAGSGLDATDADNVEQAVRAVVGGNPEDDDTGFLDNTVISPQKMAIKERKRNA